MNIKDLKQRTKTLVGNPIILTEVFGGQADQYILSIMFHRTRSGDERIKLVTTSIGDLITNRDHYIRLKDLLIFPDDVSIFIDGYEEEPWILAEGFHIDYDNDTLTLCGYDTDTITLADLVMEARKHNIPFDRVHIYADPEYTLHIANTNLVQGNCSIFLDVDVHNEGNRKPSGPCPRPQKNYKKITPQFLFEYFQENVPYISITLEIVREFLNSDLKCEKVEPNIEILTDLLRDYILSQNLVSAEDIEE